MNTIEYYCIDSLLSATNTIEIIKIKPLDALCRNVLQNEMTAKTFVFAISCLQNVTNYIDSYEFK